MVIGGIGSLWGTLVGGIVLGVAQTIGAQINPQYPVLFGNLVFLAVLIAPQQPGHRRPDATGMTTLALTPHVERWSRGSIMRTAVIGLVIVGLFFVPTTLDTNITQKLTGLWILILMAAMWNALAGYGGLVSVGQQAFIGIGAYATIYLTHAGVDGYLAMAIAVLITAVFGFVTSFVVLRLRGGEFAIAMWVIAEVFRQLVVARHLRRRRNRDLVHGSERHRPRLPPRVHLLVGAGGRRRRPPGPVRPPAKPLSAPRSRRSATTSLRPRRLASASSRASA